MQRIEYILKHNVYIQKTYKVLMSLVFKSIGIFVKTEKNLVLFNGHGWKINDSPKAIYDHMINDKKFNEYRMVWAVKNPEEYSNKKIEIIKMDSLKYFITALKSKYWISCVNIERGLNFKKKSTIYLNTWHGIPLKKIGNTVSGRNDFDFSKINYFSYSSEYEEKIYLNAFNLDKHSLIKTGLPRNDILFKIQLHSSVKENTRKNLNLDSSKKIILYAPTWRDSDDKGKQYSLKPPIDFKKWEEEIGDEYIVLLRTHSYTNKLLGVNFNKFIIDVSDYPNINELMILSDILISDYSATIFDYSILEKPIFCFGYDYKEYLESRGFYINLNEELPNGVISEEINLLSQIKNMNVQIQSEKTKEFKNKYIDYNLNATLECVNTIFGGKKVEKNNLN
ncbi:CDP-glycerol:poly(glycerophosphate) glycerophosphotransferase [Exiguobacterium sibiricum 255-15]|uniref:CDP-glycerol:poly(Glycerophosphate) glycerophosphotransferase n=1 Tax=Exiguobacterium sibiricum (strain DSM 17290 / CCUG 55495 / CIP 109462 / JCM 13490 / 255-15) TaxID=262543 RepID=B1YML9_EXIS2|nr:CDP-glycerol glycerophosphotransferase family protein [Exiguobacterium sibiricum]ACB62079.1 CDP-glycerol:poly(glycerophosphate) glycerophosphotransferase [Exiguobacterium sibiricum 255-15]